MINNLLLDDQLSKVSEINYDGDDVLKQQRLGAIAVNQLVANFTLLKQPTHLRSCCGGYFSLIGQRNPLLQCEPNFTLRFAPLFLGVVFNY